VKYSNNVLRDLASKWLDRSSIPRVFNIISDTSDFYRVDYDDVVIFNDRPYLIRQNEREGRFGIEEQQKFWVKRVVDLLDGSKKIMKLVFHERFQAKVGPLVFDCVRSPAKEARVLRHVSEHPNFMHGFAVRDAAGNNVRIIDFIAGQKLSDHVEEIKKTHAEYFREDFPRLFRGFIETVEALLFLHQKKEIHGDVRRDHIIIDRTTGKFRWIDFDFIYHHHESKLGYDIFGLGNILAFLTGGGDITVQTLNREHPDILSDLSRDDFNIIFRNRLVNLKKVFPYIPGPLNTVLLYFSMGTEIFYDDTRDFLDDLLEAEEALSSS
jgi:hypothetical protein